LVDPAAAGYRLMHHVTSAVTQKQLFFSEGARREYLSHAETTPSYKTCRPSVLVGRGRVWCRAPIGSDAERRLRTDTGRSEVDEVGFVVLKTVVVVSLILVARVFAFVPGKRQAIHRNSETTGNSQV
jgi:hypothetical protein